MVGGCEGEYMRCNGFDSIAEILFILSVCDDLCFLLFLLVIFAHIIMRM